MKKLLASIICAGAIASNAQTNVTTLDHIINLIGSPTNYAAEVYVTYAPKAPTKVGAGVLTIFNVSQFVGLGLGLDYLGSLSLVSGNVQLSLPYHPLPSQYPSLVLTPFTIAGVATAYGGAGNFNGAVSTVLDAGVAVKFGHLWGGQFNTGACYGQWGGLGAYDVKRYHYFFGWCKGF